VIYLPNRSQVGYLGGGNFLHLIKVCRQTIISLFVVILLPAATKVITSKTVGEQNCCS